VSSEQLKAKINGQWSVAQPTEHYIVSLVAFGGSSDKTSGDGPMIYFLAIIFPITLSPKPPKPFRVLHFIDSFHLNAAAATIHPMMVWLLLLTAYGLLLT
jgi:hypothetical protein